MVNVPHKYVSNESVCDKLISKTMAHFLSVIFIIIFQLVATQGYKPMDYGYHIDVVNGSYSTDITVTVSAYRESIIHFEDSTSHFPYTVFAWSDQADPSFPVFIMVRQQKEATSWEIPLLVKSREGILSFHNTSRTLCHNNIDLIDQMPGNTLHFNNQNGVQQYGLHKRLTMSVSTSYNISTNVTVRVEEQANFYLNENQNYSVTISPSEPRFFYYKFPAKNALDTEGTVILEVESEDDTCFTVSIQHATCPVFDLNEDISYEGEYETVSTKGGIIIKETTFPNGIFIVLVAKGDNFDCDKKNSVIPLQKRRNIKPSNHSSVVMFKITPNITKDKYLVVSVSTLAGFLIFYVVFGVIYCEFCSSYKRCKGTSEEGYRNLENDAQDGKEEDAVPSGSAQTEVSSKTCTDSVAVEIHQNSYLEIQAETSGIRNEIDNSLNCSESSLYQSIREPNEKRNKESTNLTEVINEIIQEEQRDDTVIENNRFVWIDERLLSPQLFLSDLATKKQKHLHRESINYFLHVITIGIFYGIPVVQLVITHQRILIITGNLDICYYNFLCAHPFIGLNDYNHVLSNIGYVLLGILFVIITRLHKKMRPDDNCGIPKHYGLFYAMGTALIMEGILSACYHVCPNQSNFQFDTSFMYVMAVLCIIKLYQNRHPDINATAYVTFVILAVAVLIAMVGILNGHILVWILFIILYSVLMIFIAIKVYFVNESRRGFQLVYEIRKNSGIFRAMRPIKKDRFIAVAIVTVLNIVMVNMGYLCYASHVDFGTFFLGLLMGNVIIYTVIYVIMKIRYREKLSIQSMLYLILAGISWGSATYFFINNSSEWMVTPSESRKSNTECTLFNFYDYHDIWHLLSAPALFFSFMLLLTLDDELVNLPRNQIVVF